jgi:hypothetical protein
MMFSRGLSVRCLDAKQCLPIVRKHCRQTVCRQCLLVCTSLLKTCSRSTNSTRKILYEIWGSHGGNIRGGLRCGVWACGWVPTFRRQYVPPKRWYPPSSPHGVTTQKTNMDNTEYGDSTFIHIETTTVWESLWFALYSVQFESKGTNRHCIIGALNIYLDKIRPRTESSVTRRSRSECQQLT